MAFTYIEHYRLVVNGAEGILYISTRGLPELIGINESKMGALARGKYKDQDRAELVRALDLPIKGQVLKSRWFDLDTVNDILRTVEDYDLKEQATIITKSLENCGLSDILHVRAHVHRHRRIQLWVYNDIVFVQPNNTNQGTPKLDAMALRQIEDADEGSFTEEEAN